VPPVGGPIRVKPKRKAAAPSRVKPATIFGPLGRGDEALSRAQGQARRRTSRAQKRLPERPLPAIPTLRHPSRRQQATARRLVSDSRVRQAGTDPRALAALDEELAQDPRSRRRLAPVTGRTQKLQRSADVRTGLVVLRENPKAYGISAKQLRLLHAAAVRGAIPEPIREKLAAIGRERVASNRAVVTPGHKHGLTLPLGAGTIDLAAAAGPLIDRARSGHGLAAENFFLHSAPGLAKRGAGDIIGFPRNAVLGLAEAGHAGYDAAVHGDLKRAKRLGEGLTRGAAGELLIHGDPAASLRAFSEHPVYGALDFAGAGAIAGRALGAGARLGGTIAGEGSALARAGSLTRAPLHLYPGSRQVIERRYSPNLIVKGLQVANDKRLRRRGIDPNVARPSSIPFRGQTHRFNQAVDEFTSRVEGTRRIGREEAKRAGERMVPTRRGASAGTRRDRGVAAVDRRAPDRARRERDVLQAVVERRVHVRRDSTPEEFKAELLRERDRLQKVYREERVTMTVAARRANRMQVRALTRAAEDPAVLTNARAVAEAAERFTGEADKLERTLIGQGVLDRDQALAAKVRPVAIARFGYRHDPKGTPLERAVAQHDALKAREATARDKLARARRDVEKAQSARDRLIGAKAPKAQRDRATQAVKDARGRRRAADAAFRTARRERVQAHPRNHVTGLVDEHGRRVTTRQIVDRMRAEGIPMPAFVSHRMDTRGSRAYFVNWMSSRKTVDSAKRTGEATRTGAHASDFDSLLEHLVHHRGVVDAVKSFDDFVREFGVRHPDGRMLTADEVDAFLQHHGYVDSHGNRPPNRPELVPVRAVPARYSQSTRDAIADRQNALRHPDHSNLVEQRIAEATRPAEGAAGKVRNVVLVPKVQLDRFSEHQLSRTTALGKAGQAGTGLFRGTVLPFSTKWLFGNVAEATLRLAAVGSTPFDIARSYRLTSTLTRLDETAAKRFQARTRGGLVYGSADRLKVHRPAEAFEHTVFSTPAKAIEAIGHVPVIKQTIGGLQALQRGIFAMNRGLEVASQRAAIGKELRRDVHALSGSWGKAVIAQRAAVEDVARGLLNSPAQVRYARAVDETLGQYSRFSPSTRRFVQGFAPFLPWYLNSLRFVMHTLPVKHPAKTALLANIERTFAADWKEQHKDTPPGDLESAIRTKDGGYLDLARFTPFGAFTHGAEGIVDPLLPQISGVAKILQGQSWTGEKLKLSDNPDRVTEGRKIWMALYAALEAAVPGIAIARRLQEGGNTAFDDSTVFSPKTKPGTAHGSAGDRVFNPLRATYLKKKKSGGFDFGSAKGPSLSQGFDFASAH
jgi:hypothetical protein